MRPLRIASLVVGSLLVIPAVALLVSGASLGLTYLIGRDDAGYLEASIDEIRSETSAVVSEEVDLTVGPGSPDRVIDSLDVDVRIRVHGGDGEELFVGIAPSAEVDGYLAGVAHEEVVGVDDDGVVLRSRTGASVATAPTEQTFWVVSSAGPGTREIEWEATDGRWTVVVMNADGRPGISFDADIGARAGVLATVVAGLLGVGVVLTVSAVSLIVLGAVGGSGRTTRSEPIGAERHVAEAPAASPAASHYPAVLEAELDPGISRWQWLVKWVLAIPHIIVLLFLWIAFVVLTAVAGISVLLTTRYPRRIFDFNVGVLRWTWRVSYYAGTGGIGTDRYPPFTLAAVPDYPASFEVAHPEQLSRWQVLVKWWLLAIPHYLVVAVLSGGVSWTAGSGEGGFGTTSGNGLLGVLVVIAGVILLVTGRYPTPLFDLIVGLNRWIYRVVVYAALMTDRYPPFRLDQGGAEHRPADPSPNGQPPEPSAIEREAAPSLAD